MVKICTHHSFSKWQKLQLQSDKLLVQTPNLTKMVFGMVLQEYFETYYVKKH